MFPVKAVQRSKRTAQPNPWEGMALHFSLVCMYNRRWILLFWYAMTEVLVEGVLIDSVG
jgi:hypothetical protein